MSLRGLRPNFGAGRAITSTNPGVPLSHHLADIKATTLSRECLQTSPGNAKLNMDIVTYLTLAGHDRICVEELRKRRAQQQETMAK
jgi:hypothetical protein